MEQISIHFHGSATELHFLKEKLLWLILWPVWDLAIHSLQQSDEIKMLFILRHRWEAAPHFLLHLFLVHFIKFYPPRFLWPVIRYHQSELEAVQIFMDTSAINVCFAWNLIKKAGKWRNFDPLFCLDTVPFTSSAHCSPKYILISSKLYEAIFWQDNFRGKTFSISQNQLWKVNFIYLLASLESTIGTVTYIPRMILTSKRASQLPVMLQTERLLNFNDAFEQTFLRLFKTTFNFSRVGCFYLFRLLLRIPSRCYQNKAKLNFPSAPFRYLLLTKSCKVKRSILKKKLFC